VERDLEELLTRVEEENRAPTNQMDSSQTSWRKWEQYLKPHVYKPFIIIYVFNIMQIVCGTNLFIFYTVDIISGLKTDGSLDSKLVANLTSIVRVVFMVVSCVILLWVARRAICVSSGLGSGISAVMIGTFVYMQNVHTWVISGLVLLYVAFNTYGYFVMPAIMVGEILPSKIRCVGGAYIYTMNDIGMFVATKAFPSVARAVGTHGIFWTFGVSSLLSALFLYLMLPETKGRSLVQIEEYFLQRNVLWLTRKKCQRGRNRII
jgi:hypothetical protein